MASSVASWRVDHPFRSIRVRNARRLLDRPEVLAQHVLDQLQCQHIRRANRPVQDHASHGRYPRHLRGPPSPLTEDDQVDPPALVPADPDRLELALGLHRRGQAGQGLLVELLSWLIRVAVELVEGDLRDIPAPSDPLEAVWGRGGDRGRCTVHRGVSRGASRAHALGGDAARGTHQLVKLPHHAASVTGGSMHCASANRKTISSASTLTALALAPLGLYWAIGLRWAMASL